MPLHDVTWVALVTDSAAESLPDPALHSGRAHTLFNNSDGAVTWSAVGANPFSTNGALSATLVIPGGGVRSLRSDGAKWIVDSGVQAPLKSFRATGVTDAAGNVVFNMSAAAFAAAPTTTLGLSGAPVDATEARVTALTAASCTVNVRRSPAVTILGISVLSAAVPAVGVTVHLQAFPAGSQA